ncbi:hypothetical protein ACHWQZ_G002951 [Mnemiopsis leidyi]
MVEVVNLDSDEEEDNLTCYNSLTATVKQLSPSGGLFDALVYNLDEVKRRCPESYLRSDEFKQHLLACRSDLNLLNFTSKLNALVQNMVSYCIDIPSVDQSDQPQKRRRLDPPRPDKTTDPEIVYLSEGASNSSTTSQPRLPVVCRAIPIYTTSCTTTTTSNSSRNSPVTQPSNEIPEFEEIMENLRTINEKFSSEPDVKNVLTVFISRIRSLNLDKNQKSLSSVNSYCSKLSLEVKTPLSLLHHLRRLLMMRYFLEINPVEIKPDDWFTAYYQIVPYHLSEYVMFAIFKRLLAKVLPSTKTKMVDLFYQKFRSALHGVKRTVLDRISQVEFTDDDDKLQNKSYAATILCCLGDCMEIFIKSKTSTTSRKDSSRDSSPAIVDVESKKSRDSSPAIVDVESKKSRDSSPAIEDVESKKSCDSGSEKTKEQVTRPEGSSVSPRNSSPHNGSLGKQNIIALPANTDVTDNSHSSKSGDDEKSSEMGDCEETDQEQKNRAGTEKEREGETVEEDEREVVEDSEKEKELDMNDKERDGKSENVTEEQVRQPEEISQQKNDEILKFSCIIASVDEQQSNLPDVSAPSSVVPPAEAGEEFKPSCDESMSTDSTDNDKQCDSGLTVQPVENLAATQNDSVESLEVEQDSEQKREARLTSDSLEIIEPNERAAESEDVRLPSFDHSASDSSTKPGTASPSDNDSSKNSSGESVEPATSSTDDTAREQPKQLSKTTDTSMGSTKHSNKVQDEDLSADSVEIREEESQQDRPFSLSQQSVEFIEETSRDCMITSVKPGNVQYVEIKLGSVKGTPKFSSSKDHKTQSDKLPETEQNDLTTEKETPISDPTVKPSPPKPPKRVTLQSFGSSTTENDKKLDSGKKRLGLKAATEAVRIPDCFKMDVQPSSSFITISDSDDEMEPKEESESEDPDVDEEAEEYRQKVAQIEKLSRKLVRLARRIKAVQEADIDDSEMDKWGNLYLQESKLKKKHRKILAKLEEIQGELNCHYYFNVKINCGIPVLSNYIEERLNARQKFPDIQDVRRLIERGLKECKISMKEKKIKTLAKQVFLDAGSQIQNHRKTELKLDGGFHLMDQVDITKDPAKEDPVLRKKLQKNKSEAKRKLRDIQETFNARQLERELLDKDIFDDGASEGDDSSKKENVNENQTTTEKSENESETESECSEKESESEGPGGSDDDEDEDADD